MHIVPHSRLGFKLILFVGAVLLVYTVLFLFFVLRVERDKALAAAEAEAVRLSDTIRKSVEFEMLKGRRESVQDIVEAITRQKGIEQVSVFNKDGEIIVSNNSEDVGKVFDKTSQTCYFCHSDDPPTAVIAADRKTSRIFDSDKGTVFWERWLRFITRRAAILRRVMFILRRPRSSG